MLGSASPRRHAILSELGLAVSVVAAEIDESPLAGEPAEPYLERIVRDKLRAVAERVGHAPHAGILVADTSVLVDGEILGKPADVADAERLLRRIAGRAHEVHTRYALSVPPRSSEPAHERTVETRVTMRAASDEELRGYAETGEGLDKAGAYAVQGIGSFLVERVEGSYSNVVGLPVCELVLDLRALGLLGRFP